MGNPRGTLRGVIEGNWRGGCDVPSSGPNTKSARFLLRLVGLETSDVVRIREGPGEGGCGGITIGAVVLVGDWIASMTESSSAFALEDWRFDCGRSVMIFTGGGAARATTAEGDADLTTTGTGLATYSPNMNFCAERNIMKVLTRLAPPPTE